MKKNHVLSSEAERRCAKLIPSYIGPYKIVEVMGTNTYRLIDEKGNQVVLALASQLKPLYSSATEEESQKSEGEDDAQPPRDASKIAGASDAPPSGERIFDCDQSDAASGLSKATSRRINSARIPGTNPATKKRGQPARKIYIYTARRALQVASRPRAEATAPQKRPGRPNTPRSNNPTSPRKMRAQRARDQK